MAGLGLVNALDQYQQGVQFKQQQDEHALQQKRRDNLLAADKAASDVIDGSKAEWALNGAQGTYTPNDTTMFKAAEARGQALAKAGDWESFLKNEATVQGQRMRVRSSAMQRYQQDGDIEALARTVYPTVFDGKEITSVEKIQGADAVQGLSAIPNKVKFKLSDGSEQTFEPQQIVAMVKQSLIDPQKAAEQEIALNFAQAKNDIETKGKVRVERAKGEEARSTEGVKAEHAKGLAGVKFGYDRQLNDATNASRETVAAGNNRATLGSATIHAGATRDAATIGGESRVAAAETRAAAAASKPGKSLSPKDRLKMVEDSFGDLNQGGFGANRVGNAFTAKVLQGMEAYLQQNPDASESEAMNAAAAVAAKRMGVQLPQSKGGG